MAKHSTHSQGSFSFFDDVEKSEPQPKKHVLKPPSQIKVAEEEIVEPVTIKDTDTPEESLKVQLEEANDFSTEESLPKEEFPEVNETESKILDIEALEDEIPPRIEERKSARGRKSVKEHEMAAAKVEMPDDQTLYSKHYYSMRDVTTMLNENHSLIRYWETEFDILKPKKNGKGDRFFRPVDVKNLYLIYDLLRRRKFTIEGAKEYLRNNKNAEEKFATIQSLEKIKEFFLQLKASL